MWEFGLNFIFAMVGFLFGYVGNVQSKGRLGSRRDVCIARIGCGNKDKNKCFEGAYLYCDNGYCMSHCRNMSNCQGLCINNQQKLLQETSEL